MTNPIRLVAITLALFGAMLLLMASANADTLTLSWTAPTAREDGTALPAAEIASYRVTYTYPTTLPSFTVAGSAVTHTIQNLASGRYCVVMQTIDTDGLESVLSNEACRRAKPNSPSGLRLR